MKRRNFIHTLAALPVISATASGFDPVRMHSLKGNAVNNRLKISLNAFSFNKPLLDGSMDLHELLEFCADQGFFAADLTAYYFKGYPEVPPDEMIYQVKRKALLKGIEISGTGVRNDFTYADEARRKAEVSLVTNWIDVAVKLGAPVIRIFAGNQKITRHSRDEVLEWMVKDILTCVEYGKNRGVVVAIQNHDDFIKTADQAITILKRVNSPWFGLILDSGSYRQADPYTEIAKTVNYAVNWQIKEEVFIDQKPEKVDLVRLFKIIKDSGYRGYLPLETLGEGDPFTMVPAFMKRASEALETLYQ
jgi:sugar phosphate isomerase/epimerase